MTRYFAQNTPRAGLEHMMMSVPGFQKRGGGMMILSRFCYKPEDVDCRYCLHYRRRSCQVRTCPYIAERLKSGAIEYLDLILEYFGHIPHAGLHKRIQAVEHWSGPDQAVLHTVSVHLRSRFADRVWDDAPPGYLAALYSHRHRSPCRVQPPACGCVQKQRGGQHSERSSAQRRNRFGRGYGRAR